MADKSSAKDQRRLGRLLQKKRGYDKAAQVEEILISDRSLSEKIEAIEDIDNESVIIHPAVETEKNRQKKPSDKRGRIQHYIKKHGLTGNREAQQNRKKLKRRIRPAGLFEFLFSDYGKIKNFGNRTGLYKTVLLPPGVKLRKKAVNTLNNDLKSLVTELLPVLRNVLQMGWFHLEKKEYNRVKLFYDLAGALEDVDLNRLNLNSSDLLTRIHHIEILFLSCYYSPEVPDRILNAVKVVIHNYPKWGYSSARVNQLMRSILDPEILEISFMNFITAVNIYTYNRYLRFEDLLSRSGEPVINDFEFDTDPATASSISRYIENESEKLGRLLRERDLSHSFQNYMPAVNDDNGGYDFYFLRNYYSRAGFDFDYDRQNTLIFIQNFFESFIKIFSGYLAEIIEIEPVQQVQIFARDFFQSEIEEIRHLLYRMDRFRLSFLEFQRDRFLEVLANAHTRSANETAILHLINDFTRTAYSIAVKLIEVQRMHAHTEGPSEEPVDSGMYAAKKVIVPYADNRILIPVFLKGKTVLEAASVIIKLLLSVSLFLENKDLKNLIKRDEKLPQMINDTKRSLERVANRIDYNEIMKSIGLPVEDSV